LAEIISSYNLLGLADAADKNKFCYRHPLNQQRECFDNNGACIKAQRNDPLADSGCQSSSKKSDYFLCYKRLEKLSFHRESI